MMAMKIAKAGLADQSLKGGKMSEKTMPKSGILLIKSHRATPGTRKLGHSEFPDVEVVGLAGAEVTGGAGTNRGLARTENGNWPSLRGNFRRRSAWPSP